MKPTVVVKFGGTSVSTEAGRRAAGEHICDLQAQGFQVVAVVSAMGRRGDPYATDTLLELLGQNTVSPLTRDLLASCGETIAACVLAQELEHMGISAQPMSALSAGIRTDGVYGEAEITAMDPQKVKAVLKANAVPVITGFQGISPAQEVTTLGRGGSDTSAAAVGGFLGAEAVIIFTDVPGIAAVDPRIIHEAPFLTEISYEDCLVLAECGAKVVHPRAVRIARDQKIPLWVRSTFDRRPGTRIGTLASPMQGLIGITAAREADRQVVSCLVRGCLSFTALPRDLTPTEIRETANGGTLFQFHLEPGQENALIRRLFRHYHVQPVP